MPVTLGLLHKTFTREKLWLFYPEFFFSYGKVNGKTMLIWVFMFYQRFFSGNSFMQYM